ncbi:hypothetical protein BO70DRAFT_399622 [Aspergillus heteromorphus CBS 117.55]|uniref:Flavin reductase like domain-containing protein n=1 Tax=Aspergillus heteromorphus CBS 117.55 TaxID=1448321 RepID=A0A317VC73_9EURO|nr:uncharacterized protein BO70DRAFT_399622 [Aspergillus heteromorphus CBS 117.55]PWY71009.1 hypothetical protein BO70DRAFT_399622 [Aspergillus heteromorphus CBS 117.55]
MTTLVRCVRQPPQQTTAAPDDATARAKANYKIVQDHGNFKEIESKRPRASKKHHEIDPYAADRPMINNYRLLVSGIAPRPIGFISTVSADGQTENLAPFSYFQAMDHDPPMFMVGFSSRPGPVKDTGECVINTVSENMIEAVNVTSIDAPYGVSEWKVSGCTRRRARR